MYVLLAILCVVGRSAMQLGDPDEEPDQPAEHAEPGGQPLAIHLQGYGIDDPDLSDMLSQVLQWGPGQRCTADQALSSAWLAPAGPALQLPSTAAPLFADTAAAAGTGAAPSHAMEAAAAAEWALGADECIAGQEACSAPFSSGGAAEAHTGKYPAAVAAIFACLPTTATSAITDWSEGRKLYCGMAWHGMAVLLHDCMQAYWGSVPYKRLQQRPLI